MRVCIGLALLTGLMFLSASPGLAAGEAVATGENAAAPDKASANDTPATTSAPTATSAPATAEKGSAGTGDKEPSAEGCCGDEEQTTLTNGWFGLGKVLDEHGLYAALTLTQVLQRNTHGGLSTHRESGNYVGLYDLELGADMEKIAKIPGGSIYALVEGSWSSGVGPSMVGSFFDPDYNAAGDEPVYVRELWYEQKLLGDKIAVRAGKLDLRGTFECHGCPVSFDGNTYANDATEQFLNGALVTNPTIPFPDPGMGAVVHVQPLDIWYFSAGVGDAEARPTTTGFETAFHGPADFFSIYETGITPELPSAKGPLQGAYRVGTWYDPQPKERFDGRIKRDDMGLYISVDQVLLRENADAEDTQGLAVFGRYGWADRDVSELDNFWSVGTQYQGLLPSRDNDVVAFAVAQGITSKEAGFARPQETVYELYYSIAITPYILLTPDIQYIKNPGADGLGDAIIPGLRLVVKF